MRIAFVVEVFPSLSQTFVLNQVVGLIEQGHEVDIYAEIKGDSHKIHPDVEKYDLLKRTYYHPEAAQSQAQRVKTGISIFLRHFFKDPILAFKAINLLKYGKAAASLRLLHAVVPFLGKRPSYDMIHCHFGLLGLKGMMLRDMGALSGKLATTFHGVDMSQNLQLLGEDLYTPLFKSGDCFLPISQYWKSRLIELGCDADKIFIHRMGIDSEKFVFRSRTKAAHEPAKLISVSRLAEKKGLEYGIRAVAALVQEGLQLEYLIIGDGELREPLTSLIDQLAVGHAVKLLGPKNHTEVLETLGSSHILLAPSITAKDGNQEGIPVALMEAMAMGMPVVSTFHSGIPELVEDGISGYLVAEKDTDALSEKLRALVQQPESWPAMGASGRKKVEDEYDIHKLNVRLCNLFKAVLNTQKPAELQQGEFQAGPADIEAYRTPANQ